MMLFEYISFFLLVFTSLIGIFSIVKFITEWIYDDNTNLHTISILPIKGHDDRVEMLLRSFFSKNEGNVIIVDLGMDDETKKMLLHIKGSRENVAILKQNELQGYLNEIIGTVTSSQT